MCVEKGMERATSNFFIFYFLNGMQSPPVVFFIAEIH